MKKVIGMGNPLVDLLLTIKDENILNHLDLPKGSMQLVDKKRHDSILNFFNQHDKKLAAGGSAANTIHGMAKLGAPVGYMGVIGEDEMGGFFVQDMINAGVEPHMIHSETETGVAITLITPDSERTFATYLGASVELKPSDVREFNFSRYQVLHIEGYQVQNHELIETAVHMAHQAGLEISVDLASYNVVEENRDFLESLIRQYVDIVFANEDEAKALTGKEPREALNDIAEMCRIAVVKTGGKGSMVKSGNEYHEIGVIPVKPIDTTGAGDLYASGFLFGLINDRPLDECGRIGALLAGNVIEVMGSKMNYETWELIKNSI
ncbi:MAG: adenosine kinase [Bacteroidota bacterium]|nr:adenosine kinase [Bacteroidota bacterium]